MLKGRRRRSRMSDDGSIPPDAALGTSASAAAPTTSTFVSPCVGAGGGLGRGGNAIEGVASASPAVGNISSTASSTRRGKEAGHGGSTALVLQHQSHSSSAPAPDVGTTQAPAHAPTDNNSNNSSCSTHNDGGQFGANASSSTGSTAGGAGDAAKSTRGRLNKPALTLDLSRIQNQFQRPAGAKASPTSTEGILQITPSGSSTAAASSNSGVASLPAPITSSSNNTHAGSSSSSSSSGKNSSGKRSRLGGSSV
eukprot:scaffold90011_cov17-Tisochrysis_lutea.AAC.1